MHIGMVCSKFTEPRLNYSDMIEVGCYFMQIHTNAKQNNTYIGGGGSSSYVFSGLGCSRVILLNFRV